MLKLTAGFPEPLGVTLNDDGANIAVFSAHAEAIEFCLFDEADREVQRIRLTERTGDVFHAHIAAIEVGQRYGLRAYGPYAPQQGHRFNPNKLLLDPYARQIDRPFKLHDSMFGYRRNDPALDLSFDATDSAPFMPKAVVGEASQAARSSDPRAGSRVPWGKTVLYELHVRGFTKRHPQVPEKLHGTFAGLAHPAAIDHLVRLGITSVELMPAMAGLDERHLAPLGLVNYWNYNPIGWCAFEPKLAPGGWAEIRSTVAALQAAGIEVLLDVVLNHSAEGDALGPTVSLRGLDNASYYRLRPDDPRHYIDDAGCGNILACDRPQVVRLAMDALRTWAQNAGLDGFRFDLMTTLGRGDNGFDSAAPLLTAIAQDPILRDLKIIAEPWDIGPGGYQTGYFNANWGEWNDKYRDCIRRFWRGDPYLLGDLATRVAGSEDLFGRKRRPSRSVNFITAHDGLTLADLTSYAGKHNLANGENNRDGTDANNSWNHGIEGPSEETAIRAARLQDQRNLLATLLFSRGTPMLSMGSECGQSQNGNNNAYAQDNEISWLDWDKADAGLAAFCAKLIALRQSHAALCSDHFLTGAPGEESWLPDVAWYAPDGQALRDAAWHDPNLNTLIASLAAPDQAPQSLDRVVVVLHAGAQSIDITLPETRAHYAWRRAVDTAAPDASEMPWIAATAQTTVAPRSVVLFVEEIGATQLARPQGVASDLLDTLARGAGIASDWWDVGGTNHRVPDATKQALLAGMGLDAATNTQARESLAYLSERRDRRILPEAAVGQADTPVTIRLTLPRNVPLPNGNLIVQSESSEEIVVPLAATRPTLRDWRAADDRISTAYLLTLPPLPQGRARVWLESQPNDICRLTVAPRGCYLPDELRQGAKRFGVAAHLYALRGRSDQGIGDFSTLRDFAHASAAQGAALVGLNPMHALFETDRERASPYHPSDRRFLDPIYIDVTAGSVIGHAPAAKALLDSNARAIEALTARRMIDYPAVWNVKRAILEASFAAFSAGAAPDLAQAFAAFVRQGGPALENFARFATIAETRQGEAWSEWPDALRAPQGADVASFLAQNEQDYRFQLYLQFLCEQQFAAAAQNDLALGFYRDIAVGAAPDSAEVWAGGAYFMRGVSIGAPPDPFSASGQVWNLPPPNPLRMAQEGFASFAALIAANMRHAGALRIDHVMGLTRLFQVPDGAQGKDGAYVAYPFEEMLAEVALESAKARCLVVGEDLGTVPEGFRERLAAADMLSYKVLFFERDGIAFNPPAAYPDKAIACVSTHDLPTFKGWWQGVDIAENETLGKLSEDSVRAHMAMREAEKAALQEALREDGLDDTPSTDAPITQVHAAVAQTPCMLVLAQADDLAGETDGINLPGTDRERPNWRRRVSATVDDLFEGTEAKAIIAAMQKGRVNLSSV
ncbi:glycogen debranching protein GlgX [Methylovirgula sp. 4M-Z18]|uniref:glycogen debranching protein GlgX n=1 Tax=Methylovirgula sp. 4M-Z18 TaxID=2293567 RepID=UPI001FDFE193|nr:glycogen debranching protein GlgX [Methylovirgula sp. 4M-Z18]